MAPDGKRLHHQHTARASVSSSRPVHITVRVRKGLPSLRGAVLAPFVLKCFEAGNERAGFRLVHFSLQTNHWHLICEADGTAALSAAIKGLNVRIAKVINKRLGYWKEGELNVLATQSAATVVKPAQCYLLREGLRRVEWLSLLDAPPATEKGGPKGAQQPKQRAAQERRAVALVHASASDAGPRTQGLGRRAPDAGPRTLRDRGS